MWNLLIGLLNAIIYALGAILGAILAILPDSPFAMLSSLPKPAAITGLAWLIPFDYIIAVLQAWGIAVGIFYLYKIPMRWGKMIQ